MNHFTILSIFLVQFSILSTAPTENKRIEDDIIEICPKFKNVTENDFGLKSCQNWNEIKNVKSLKDNSKNEVLCLLYYDNFVNYCKQRKEVNTSEIITELSQLESNIDQICSENYRIGSIDIPKTKCYILCSNLDDTIAPRCALAYHYRKLISQNVPVPPQTLKFNNLPAKKNPDVDPKEQQNQPESKKETSTSKKATSKQEEVNKLPEVPPKTLEVPEIIKPKTIEQITQVKAETGIITETKLEEPPANTKLEEAPAKTKLEETPAKLEESPANTKLEEAPAKTKLEEQPVNTNSEKIEEPQTEEEEKKPPPADDITDDLENDYTNNENPVETVVETKKEKPSSLTDDDDLMNRATPELDGDSYFFSYFMVISILSVLSYVGYHNRQKIFALVLEGKRGRRPSRSRRPNSANYHKLDSNLEEAISSSCSKTTSHVIY